jgi:putative redox protein
MKAIARRRRSTGYQHDIEVRDHLVASDEPLDSGGDDAAPSPQELLAASLASCTAITMEMYANRKGWDIGQIEVECEYTPAERGSPTKFTLALRFPSSLDPKHAERLSKIAAKCPVHRTLAGEVTFEEQIELVERTAT